MQMWFLCRHSWADLRQSPRNFTNKHGTSSSLCAAPSLLTCEPHWRLSRACGHATCTLTLRHGLKLVHGLIGQ